MFVKIYVFKLKYFKNCFEVFDGVVVIISFVLDLLHSKTSTVAELVIVARLWRVARIINGELSPTVPRVARIINGKFSSTRYCYSACF